MPTHGPLVFDRQRTADPNHSPETRSTSLPITAKSLARTLTLLACQPINAPDTKSVCADAEIGRLKGFV